MKLESVFKDGRKERYYAIEVAKTPTEGKLFEVNPLGIDRSKFEKTMSNWQQEWTRQIIQEAFAEVDKHPEKYACTFYTLMPEKKWDGYKTVAEIKAYANDLGGQMADWVEQVLELAQRIFNGESWEAICNNADTAKWCRLIRWKDGSYRLVGGSSFCEIIRPAFFVDYVMCYPNDRISYTVPLVVLKKK